MPPAWELLWGLCTGLVFQKRWLVGHSNANNINYLSAFIVPRYNLQDDTNYSTRQVAAGLPIKAQSWKKQTQWCLAIQGKMTDVL